MTFDCYGTLIDWESGIWLALQPLLARNDATDLPRSLALAVFAISESQQESSTPGLPYPEILSAVHRDIAEHLQLETDSDMDRSFGNRSRSGRPSRTAPPHYGISGPAIGW